MEKTILFWWLFVPASEPGNLKMSCMASFLITSVVLSTTFRGRTTFSRTYIQWSYVFVDYYRVNLFRFQAK